MEMRAQVLSLLVLLVVAMGVTFCGKKPVAPLKPLPSQNVPIGPQE